MAAKVNIRWVTHPELSAAHAAYIVATESSCTDPKTEQLLVGPVTNVNDRLLSSTIDVREFWQQYVSQVMLDSGLDTACESALRIAGCSELQLDQTAKAIQGQLRDARGAFMRRFPKLSEQLELRARPLRDKWDTFGPGLLRDVGRQVWADNPPSDWWHPRISALMVQPMRSGDGGYDAESGRFWLEAMLTDVDPAVPEVLRAAWLITRMAIESYTRSNSGDLALAVPWKLVAIPLVLTAAANLEVIGGDELPIARAMDLWQYADARLASTIDRWWQDYRKHPTPLPAALKVLDQEIRSLQAPAVEETWEEFDS